MNKQKPTPSGSNLSALLLEKNLQTKAVEQLEKCLKATHSFYDVDAGKIITVPDFKTILGAIQTALAYTDGKPVERREVITKHMTSLQDLQKQVKASPELRRAVAELLGEKSANDSPDAVQ